MLNKKRSSRNMPKRLQIKMLKELFLRANANNFDDPEAEMQEIDFESYVSDMTYPENLNDIKNDFPQYDWEVPKKEKIYQKDKWKLFDHNEKEDCEIWTTTVKIKPHIVNYPKNKKRGLMSNPSISRHTLYSYGIIQVNIPHKEWIGCKARISVHVPLQKKQRNRDFKGYSSSNRN